jgi:hypothetical protein
VIVESQASGLANACWTVFSSNFPSFSEVTCSGGGSQQHMFVLRAAANLELITRVCVIARSANGCFADTEAKGSDLGLVILNVLGSLTFKSDSAGE